MKKLKITIFLFLILTIYTGCENDFLDRKPIGRETTESFFGNERDAEENFEKMIVAAYTPLNYDETSYGTAGWDGVGHHGEWMWDIITDDAQKGGDGPGNQTWMLDWRFWRTSPALMGPAQSAYVVFNVGKERANAVLDVVEKYKEGLSEDTYHRIKGEALFLRAYYYFYGVKLFGKIPYFDKPILPDQFKNPESMEPEEIYKRIEADLTEAVSLVAEKSEWLDQYGVHPEGRATKGAVWALLARVISMETGFGFNGKTWEDVYSVTKEIISSGQYDLMPNYAAIWEPEGQNSVESVFEVQCHNVNQGWGYPGSNIEPLMVSPRLTCGVNKGKNLWDGWGFMCPSLDLSSEFEPGDIRRKCTIIEDEDILWEDGNADTDEHIDISVKDKCPTLMFSRKYSQPPSRRSSNNQNSEVNKRLCRYAEVLLLHAEAAAHIGQEDEARRMVNRVRARARTSTLPKGSQLLNPGFPSITNTPDLLPDITSSGDQLLNDIYHERRVELAHEGHRLWDLIRWGKMENAIKTLVIEDYLMNPIDPDGSLTISNYKSHLIGGKVPCLPIPRGDVLTYGVKQNPGYE